MAVRTAARHYSPLLARLGTHRGSGGTALQAQLHAPWLHVPLPLSPAASVIHQCVASLTIMYGDMAHPKSTPYRCLPMLPAPGHYDTSLKLIKLAITPPEGPSVPAFNQRVAELGFYLDNNVLLRVDPLGACLGAPACLSSDQGATGGCAALAAGCLQQAGI